jgi:putative ABC transport system permease protein
MACTGRHVEHDPFLLTNQIASCCGAAGHLQLCTEPVPTMNGLLLDIRYALRSLGRTPGIFLIALVTIALGVGVNTAMFSVVNAVVLSPLPYPSSDRLVSLWPEKFWSVTMLRDAEERVTSYEAISAYTASSYTLLGDGSAEAVPGGLVSPAHFEVLGVRPRIGGGFIPGDGVSERGPVVVLSHEFWQRHLGGDPGVVGQSIRLAGQGLEQRTIVGILPRDFRPLPSTPEVWVPIIETPGEPGFYGAYGLKVIGRLRPGVTPAQASAELRSLVDEFTPLYPTQFREIRYSPVDVVPLLDTLVQGVRSQLLILLGAVGLILLIACTNVANLLLARAHGRQRQVAVQMALGCSPRRVVRQVLTESLVLGLIGGAIGVAAALLALPVITGFVSDQLPRTADIAINGPVLAFALGASILAGLVFGAVPALRAARAVPGEVMRATAGRGQSQGRRSGRVNDILVVGEVALSLVLLAGAGLMLKSVWQLTRVDPGFSAENVLTMQITLPPGRYDSLAVREVLRQRIEEQVSAVPGVAAVGSIDFLPLGIGWSGIPYRIDGREPAEEVSQVVGGRVVNPEYFEVMRIPLVQGRMLGPEDTGFEGENALLVNERFARQHWPDGGAIGGRILFGDSEGEPIGTIVGIVRDVRQQSLSEPAAPAIYASAAQVGWPTSGVLVVRGVRGVPSRDEVVAALQAVEPEIAPRNVRTMEEVLWTAAANTRFYAQLLTGFAALALLLGIVGVYGVISYAVSQRSGELGVRLALGATARDLLVNVMSRALAPVAVGIALGLGGALVLTRFLASLLFDVHAADPWVLSGVAFLLALAGAAAALVPARRATRISPVRALQGE